METRILERTFSQNKIFVISIVQQAPKYHTKGCSHSFADSPEARTLVFAAFEQFQSWEFRASIARTPFCAILWRSPNCCPFQVPGGEKKKRQNMRKRRNQDKRHNSKNNQTRYTQRRRKKKVMQVIKKREHERRNISRRRTILITIVTRKWRNIIKKEERRQEESQKTKIKKTMEWVRIIRSRDTKKATNTTNNNVDIEQNDEKLHRKNAII